jgi:hypothetical protein
MVGPVPPRARGSIPLTEDPNRDAANFRTAVNLAPPPVTTPDTAPVSSPAASSPSAAPSGRGLVRYSPEQRKENRKRSARWCDCTRPNAKQRTFKSSRR